jgi:excisionase family DNA binding protein
MQCTRSATVERIDGRALGPVDMPEMLTVGEVAEKCNCSERHVYRLVKRGEMPAPIKLGQLNRWPQQIIEEWIAAGCPALRELANGSTRNKRGGDHE